MGSGLIVTWVFQNYYELSFVANILILFKMMIKMIHLIFTGLRKLLERNHGKKYHSRVDWLVLKILTFLKNESQF
jgi:hypothetical protein